VYQPGSGMTFLHLQVQLKHLYVERMVKYLNGTVDSHAGKPNLT